MFVKYRWRVLQALAVVLLAAGIVVFQGDLRMTAAKRSVITVTADHKELTAVMLEEAVRTGVVKIEEKLAEAAAAAKEAAEAAEKAAEAEAEEASAVVLSDVWDGGNYYRPDGTLETPSMNAIMGWSITKADQLESYFTARGNRYPSYYAQNGSSGAATLGVFCQIVIEEASAEKVRPEVVFMQIMKETGWLTFTGDVSIGQYNFAGIGATGGGEPGNSFPDVRTGIRAQVQHLKAYASDEALNNACVDPRFEYVTRASSPYIEWLGIQENPNGGGWAADPGYGGAIVNMIRELN